jgi:hypothetical protein
MLNASMALKDVKPELERLKQKAIEKVYFYHPCLMFLVLIYFSDKYKLTGYSIVYRTSLYQLTTY